MRREHSDDLDQVNWRCSNVQRIEHGYKIRAMIYITITRLPKTVAAAHQGGSKGDPM